MLTGGTYISNPITDATASTLACNDDGTSGALQLTATVQAGSAITAYWYAFPLSFQRGELLNRYYS